MTLFIDARVPVRMPDTLATPVAAGDGLTDDRVAWLVEGDLAAPGPIVERFVLGTDHVPGCACCLPRGAAAEALGRLFLRRARGEVAFFDHVRVLAATPAGLAAIHAALRDDALASGRFRIAAPG